MNTFWKTIADYNAATWLYQAVIILVGIVLTVLLAKRPGKRTGLAMKIFLIATYLWISVVYYYIYCAERSYNSVMAIFWAVLACAWVWDAVTGYTQFEYNRKHALLAYVLLFMPFVYPLMSLYRGLHFPEMTSPLIPSSVVTFTIGLLLLFCRKANIFIILLLCHWALIGLSKTYFFGIPEDFLVAAASVPAIYLFFREYFLTNLHKDTKPKARYINWLLALLGVGIGLLLLGTMFYELFMDA